MKRVYSEEELRRLTIMTKTLLTLVGILLLLLSIVQPFVLLLALAVFFIAYKYKAKNKPQTDRATNATVATAHLNKTEPIPLNYFYFNVAGVTKKNDQGKSIQKLIREYVKKEVEFMEYSYGDMTNKEILESGEDVYEADISGNYEITLEPEPDNPYDPNAVKVIHSDMGHVGYVPRSHTAKALKVITGDHGIEWRIVGGRYKYVDREEEKVRTKTLTYGITVDVDYQKGVISHERPRKEKEK